MTTAKGTSSFGKRHNKSHGLCRRCGMPLSPHPGASSPPKHRDPNVECLPRHGRVCADEAIAQAAAPSTNRSMNVHLAVIPGRRSGSVRLPLPYLICPSLRILPTSVPTYSKPACRSSSLSNHHKSLRTYGRLMRRQQSTGAPKPSADRRRAQGACAACSTWRDASSTGSGRGCPRGRRA